MKFKRTRSTSDTYYSSDSEKYPTNEETKLLRKSKAERHHEWKKIGLFVWALFATVAAIFLAVASHYQRPSQHDGKLRPSGKRNLVFMVSDGMGPASLTMTRNFRQFQEALPIDDVLVLDQNLIGTSRTRSNSSFITDSAAGATAFSCGKKSYNGAISIMPDFSPCGTVLEAAKKAGYLTGLVVTTDITDATPACFASHAKFRNYRDIIALQEVGENPLGRVVDLMLGGGRCHFLPNTTKGSCRNDHIDVSKLAQEKFGWNYIDNRQSFDALSSKGAVTLPLLGLFADSDIPFEIDRRHMNHIYPSLDEMTLVALKLLDEATQNSDKGYFLMVEGSRIDHAAHMNDPSAQVREVLAYDKAFSSVKKHLEKSETEGVLVATSDHETGGLSVAKQLGVEYPSYKWYPEVLANASSSAEFLTEKLKDRIAQGAEGESLRVFIAEVLIKKGLGIFDATEEEMKRLIDEPLGSLDIFADMISRRAQIGWSSHGHSAVDVNIYGTAGSEILRGNHENTEIGEFIYRYLDVDVDAVTKELNKIPKKKNVDWTGPIPKRRNPGLYGHNGQPET
ncbi:Repressible alkaline phosphatase [Podosphaera aphanis]|nr:Repressible alkaline phosphatase [Podosphaera aphanis]